MSALAEPSLKIPNKYNVTMSVDHRLVTVIRLEDRVHPDWSSSKLIGLPERPLDFPLLGATARLHHSDLETSRPPSTGSHFQHRTRCSCATKHDSHYFLTLVILSWVDWLLASLAFRMSELRLRVRHNSITFPWH